jgi:hypothetical protein
MLCSQILKKNKSYRKIEIKEIPQHTARIVLTMTQENYAPSNFIYIHNATDIIGRP